MKKNYQNKSIISILLIIILLFTNILTIYLYLNKKTDETKESSYTLKEEKINKEDNFNPDKKYYNSINFSEFKSLYKGDKTSIIAIVDNSSYTYDKFIELINKTSYYKNIEINLIEVSKLSNKNLIKFYEIDERFSDLESDFLITVKEEKILSLIDIESTDLNTIIDDLK